MPEQHSAEPDWPAQIGVTEAEMDAAMRPIVAQVRRMAEDQGREVEEFFLSLPGDLFGALAAGYVDARRSGLTGTELHRDAAARTAHLLEHDGRADLIPLAVALRHHEL
ncbi:hypothetical protein [Streptomyces sp. NPDC001268]|uniref:hypothetical protein n=1 Tax=Streptomyces sp. NPDC001268 TaxID=3364553 RepID=UPI0036BB1A9A